MVTYLSYIFLFHITASQKFNMTERVDLSCVSQRFSHIFVPKNVLSKSLCLPLKGVNPRNFTFTVIL